MPTTDESGLYLKEGSSHGGMFFPPELLHHDGRGRVVGLYGPFDPVGHRDPNHNARVIEGSSNEVGVERHRLKFDGRLPNRASMRLEPALPNAMENLAFDSSNFMNGGDEPADNLHVVESASTVYEVEQNVVLEMLNVSFTSEEVANEATKLVAGLLVSKEHERRGANLLVVHPADDVCGVPRERARHRDEPPP